LREQILGAFGDTWHKKFSGNCVPEKFVDLTAQGQGEFGLTPRPKALSAM
jgi:hypothetical protein